MHFVSSNCILRCSEDFHNSSTLQISCKHVPIGVKVQTVKYIQNAFDSMQNLLLLGHLELANRIYCDKFKPENEFELAT